MKNKSFKIKDRLITNFGKPFITAEVGVNHNGSIETAIKMIDVAKQSGCDAVKFQTFKADEIVKDKDFKFKYTSQNKTVHESMNKMFKRYELNEKCWNIINNYCLKKKIIFFSTPQNLSDLQFLQKFNIPAIKVGSDDFVNIELIKSYLKFNKPVILSTGMSTVEDFKNILRIKGISNKKIMFLLCTSEYPTKHENVNIKKFYSMKNIIGNHLIGFSDHTKDNLASIMAVSHGCSFFEKHFTLNNNLPGPDHSFSCNPKQLKSWVDAIRNAYKCMGSSIIKPTKIEKINKENWQRKIIAKKFIKRGHIIKSDDTILLRTPDKKALPSSKLSNIIGKKSKVNIKAGDAIYL